MQRDVPQGGSTRTQIHSHCDDAEREYPNFKLQDYSIQVCTERLTNRVVYGKHKVSRWL
jgi:hypothetical protein